MIYPSSTVKKPLQCSSLVGLLKLVLLWAILFTTYNILQVVYSNSIQQKEYECGINTGGGGTPAELLPADDKSEVSSNANANINSEIIPLVVPLCNNVDVYNNSGEFQVVRAEALACSIKQPGWGLDPFKGDLIALVHGYSEAQKARLYAAGYTHVIDSPPDTFVSVDSKEDAAKQDRPWTPSNIIQRRPDGTCTMVKVNALNLTQYKHVAVSDADVVFYTNPTRWLNALVDHDYYFWSNWERYPGSFDGINTHFLFLSPNKHVYRMMIDKMKEGSYIPYINTEQDIFYSVFTYGLSKDHAEEKIIGVKRPNVRHKPKHNIMKNFCGEGWPAKCECNPDVWKATRESEMKKRGGGKEELLKELGLA